jgi:small-conductance mechanosensitive channel
LINIWGFEDWLQTTSVLGFLALFIFASKEYWAGDFLSGILIISQGRIERGDVIKIKDEELSAIVLQIGSFQTIVRDLVNKHDIILPNSKLRLARVDILKSDLKGIREFEDFWFGYGIEMKKVEEMLEEAWKKTMEEGLVDKYGGCIIANKECGDHGVRWRLAYTLKSPHKIIETGNRIREWAYQLQDKHGLQLATPLTHDLSKTNIQVQKLPNG